MKRESKFKLIAAFLTLGVLGGLTGLAEWYVRHREATRETVPGGALPGVFYRHNRTRFAFVRDNDYFHWIHINRLGFRGKEATLEKEEGVFRILAVGGSTTYDRGVSGNDLTWPSRLEVWLNDLGDQGRFEVINAGVPGYTVLDNLIRLQTELLSMQPDLVILYHAHNDLFAAMRTPVEEWSARPDEMDPFNRFDSWLGSSLLYAKVRGRLLLLSNARDMSARPLAPYADRLSAGLDGFRSDLSSFVAIANAHNVPVLLPTVVTVRAEETDYWERSFPVASPSEVADAYAAYNATIVEVGVAMGASVVDTGPFEIDVTDYYEEGDPIHFNDQGAERMARNLAPALLEQLRANGLTTLVDSMPPGG